MCSGVDEDVSKAYRAKISPERRVLQVYTVYCITLHHEKRLCIHFLHSRNAPISTTSLRSQCPVLHYIHCIVLHYIIKNRLSALTGRRFFHVNECIFILFFAILFPVLYQYLLIQLILLLESMPDQNLLL